MKRFRLLLLMLPMLLSVRAAADNNALMRFAGNIHQFNEIFPQEKVYLQFDNTAYFQGETIWFKAFVVRATNLNRAPSTVLYVDLLSPNGVLLQHQKVKISAGQADGCIGLIDGQTDQARKLRGAQPYPSGYYEIRAYTQYMVNFDEGIVFSRVFPVYRTPVEEGDYSNPVIAPQSTIENQNRPEAERLRDVNVRFFPEGGHAIRGLECRMAVKATDAEGRGIQGHLSLTCEDGFQVEAETGHEGMGTFVYHPGKGNTSARFTYGGKDYKVVLPASQAAGYSLSVDNVKNAGQVDVCLTRSGLRHELSIGITVTCRGELVMFKEIQMHDGDNRLSFSTQDWPVGVCRMVVFTERGEVLASRSFFNGNTKYVPPVISVKTDRKQYGPFEKMQLAFDLRDSNGNPFRDRFCLSVRDAADYGTRYSDNLLTDMLLSSDLKGFIHNPSYYFESDDMEHRRNLDWLCMIHGWERYDWEYMSDNRIFHEQKRMEDSLSLNGWIMSNTLGKDRSLENVRIMVAIAPHDGSNVELGQVVTGPDGYFGFNMQDFYGKADLTMRISSGSDSRLEPRAKIRLDRAILPKLRAYRAEELLPVWASDFRTNATGSTANGFPTIVNESQGVALPAVDIEGKRMYVDYFTFRSFDVEKDVEDELDMGNYTTDVMGYLIDKGYVLSCPAPHLVWVQLANGSYMNSDEYLYYTAMQDLSVGVSDQGYRDVQEMWLPTNMPSSKINGHNAIWYVHDDKRSYKTGDFEVPWFIDTQDIEGILVFDELMDFPDIARHTPLSELNMNDYSVSYPSRSALRDNVLVDIKLKDASQRLSKSDKRNLGKRITTLTGLARSHEFYSPSYPDGPIPGDVDYRRTLYWNPNVITDSLGHAQVEFYNNSYSTGFNVSGAGMTASGSPYVLDVNF